MVMALCDTWHCKGPHMGPMAMCYSVTMAMAWVIYWCDILMQSVDSDHMMIRCVGCRFACRVNRNPMSTPNICHYVSPMQQPMIPTNESPMTSTHTLRDLSIGCHAIYATCLSNAISSESTCSDSFALSCCQAPIYSVIIGKVI